MLIPFRRYAHLTFPRVRVYSSSRSNHSYCESKRDCPVLTDWCLSSIELSNMQNCEKLINKHSLEREVEFIAFVMLITVFLMSQRISLKTLTKVINHFIECRRIVHKKWCLFLCYLRVDSRESLCRVAVWTQCAEVWSARSDFVLQQLTPLFLFLVH